MRASYRAGALGCLVAAAVLLPAAAAQAHPLGNFSVNHYHGITVRTDGVDVLAVIDIAEIPTQQAMPLIDRDGDDLLSENELAASADSQCAELLGAVQLRVDAVPVALTTDDVTLQTVPGAAGLPTLRLTCALTADARLGAPAEISYTDEFRPDRVGWHEITARGDGVRLLDPPVGAASVTDELRSYPDDLLSSPLDVRSVTLQTEPGSGGEVAQAVVPSGSTDPFTKAVSAGDRFLEETMSGELTPVLGALAVLLAMVLGAGHAMLPGHGKTVMAAYLAGRRGSPRDAVTVGATVTATHTASVLVLGLLLSAGAAIVGEQVLRWLGVVSGLLIAGVGAVLLRSALAARRRSAVVPVRERALVSAAHGDHGHAATHAGSHTLEPAHAHGHAVGHGHEHEHGHDHLHPGEHAHGHDHLHPGEHAHGHDHLHQGEHAHGHDHLHQGEHEHGHDHLHQGGHEHGHDHEHEHEHGHDHEHEHEHEHGHDHEHSHDHDHEHDHEHDQHTHDHAQPDHDHHEDHDHGRSWWSGGHTHGPGGHTHGPGGHHHGPSAVGSRGGLIGMGVAGGLVPSPSALIVLLSAIGLGRTAFGVLLVLAYGIGMAATLTIVGLLLVRVRGRLDRWDARGRLSLRASQVVAALPVVTAGLVLLVGVGLALRGAFLA